MSIYQEKWNIEILNIPTNSFFLLVKETHDRAWILHPIAIFKTIGNLVRHRNFKNAWKPCSPVAVRDHGGKWKSRSRSAITWRGKSFRRTRANRGRRVAVHVERGYRKEEEKRKERKVEVRGSPCNPYSPFQARVYEAIRAELDD